MHLMSLCGAFSGRQRTEDVSKIGEVLPILLCYTVPLYSRKQKRESARTKAFHKLESRESLVEISGWRYSSDMRGSIRQLPHD